MQYHELIFGKPLGDWYVDDKALPVEDFVAMPFTCLKGGSGDSVRREGSRVIKQGKSAKMQFDWYKLVEEICPSVVPHTPKAYEFTVDTLYMQFVEASPANLLPASFLFIIEYIDNLSLCVKVNPSCDMEKYCENFLHHIDSPWTRSVQKEILRLSDVFKKHTSFCHGDPTLSNCLITEDSYYLIDPNYKDDYNSYLVDFAKLRMSLNGFEERIILHTDEKHVLYEQALAAFDKILAKRGILRLVKLLEITCWIRLYNFKTGKDREYAECRSKTLWREYLNER